MAQSARMQLSALERGDQAKRFAEADIHTVIHQA